MCGLVGVVGFDAHCSPVDPGTLVRMRDTMVHRGPDGDGLWFANDRRVGFGFRRLRIIDLSPLADQPMSTEDGRYTIVFNGEIYNHAAIRSELTGLGELVWRTDHSDTEVLLRAFARWGIDCLPKLRGMFAFAVWDHVDRALWLARDRIGIKPLYYTRCDGRLLFASEIKALLADPTVPKRVDLEAVYHYLSFICTPAPMTMFAGISKVPSGTWLRFSASGVREQRYWDPLDQAGGQRADDEAALARDLLDRLRTSVELRKAADVPVGVFLSGGVDSSTNLALFSQGQPRQVRSFTVGYEGEHSSYPNELPYARQMADTVASEHHERLLTVDDLIEFLPTMVHLQDEPVGDPVCIPLHFLADLARGAGVVVCQAGEGSDELFFGYPWWMRMLALQRLVDRVGAPGARAGLGLLRALHRQESVRYEYLSRAAGRMPVFWSGAEVFTDVAKRSLLSPWANEQLGGLTSWVALEAAWARYRAHGEGSAAHWMTYADLQLRLPELLLMRIDKMTMGSSVEARVPFLDHELVEFALGVPPELLVKNGKLKYLLIEAVRGLVPDSLLARPKQGFGVPVAEYLLGRLGEVVRTETQSFCRDSGIIDGRAAAVVADQGSAIQVWSLFNLALWWRMWFA